MFEDDINSNTTSHFSLPGGSDSDYVPRDHLQHPQARKAPAQAAKEDSVLASLPEKRIPVILKGGEGLRAHLSELNATAKAAAYTNLQNLHLAIGAQYMRFLPSYEDIKYDETTEVGEYLPIVVRVGTYNAVVKAKKNNLKIDRKLELWAYHTNAQEPNTENPVPVYHIELVAYNDDEQHVPDLPGLEVEDTWAVKKQNIAFLPPFTHVRNETELICLVRYCLLLAAAENLYYFDGIVVPREPGFTGVLVELCKRKWEDERFETLDKVGVLPNKSDVWNGVVKLDVPRGRHVEQCSTSESEGEDEIPAVMPEDATQHLKRKIRSRRRRDS
ncbi:uncharacterized protein ALTATR162_LOCUS8740 [Alternaria atra]|uniref:Uncharacterized protein n=1 Tax=Alternaria atra TaxID=119953 RepID=A0A8J2I5Y1_9PLEO|nr:uncharacterized protein ALTATR162_LOCUS8740 [Alternaria atra]CAG5178517.1 unnamed protein product [Alternaria atra]